jgi:UDP-2,3-diacylglucosamine hydrolase
VSRIQSAGEQYGGDRGGDWADPTTGVASRGIVAPFIEEGDALPRPYILTADLHLGSASEEEESRKVAALDSLLDHAAQHAEGMAILGDLFDFWLPYRHVIPRRAVALLGRMAEVRRRGFPISFVGGNHDFWIADFLEDELGIPARAPSLSLSVAGRKILAAHGDDLIAGADPGYRFLRRLLRNPIALGAFRLIHPDVGIPLARLVSRTSRDYTSGKEFFVGPALARSLDAAFDAGHDAVVMGHLHEPKHLRLPRGECLVLGGWSGSLSIVRAEAGALHLGSWPAP